MPDSNMPALGQNAPDVSQPNTPMPGTPAPTPTPAAQQINPAQPPAPLPPGKWYENMGHAFAGALLGVGSTLSGGNEITTGYDASKIDPKTGGPTAITRPATAHDRIAKIAGAALRGLAAGTQSQGAPGNTGGAAFGAGAQAESQFEQKQDLLKRQQSAEQYKTDQEALLRRGEIARNNQLTISTHLANLKAGNELDPHYAENEAIVDAAKKSPTLQGHVREMTGSELQEAVKSDPNFLSNHIARPLGLAPTVNDDGPLMHEDGSPMQHMRYGVIDGTKDGQMVVTPDIEATIEQYGSKLLGSKPKVGDEIPIERFTSMMNALDTEKLNVIQGWNQSTVGTTVDGNKLVEVNGYDKNQTRPLKTLTEANKEAIEKGVLTKAQADEAEGKAAESRANAAILLNAAGGANHDPSLWRDQPDIQNALAALPQSAQAILHSVAPINIRPLMLVANGDAKLTDMFPASPRKGTGIIPAQVAQSYVSLINPHYTAEFFTNKQAMQKDFLSSGPQTSGGAIASFNNFLNHSAEVLDMSSQLARNGSPWLARPMNEVRSKGLGDPGVGNLDTAIAAARSEWQTFIHNGHAPTADETAAGATLMSDASTPAQIAGALRVMGQQAVGRLDSINQKWKTLTDTDYPNLITPMGKTSAAKLGLDVSAYKSGGVMPGVNTQKTPTGPDPSTHPHKTAADGKTTVFKMEDGSIQDAAGVKYDSKTLQPIQTAPAASAPAVPAQGVK